MIFTARAQDYVKCTSVGVASSCSVFGTSGSAVATWPLYFGISIQSVSSSAVPTCYDLQWLSATDAATW